MDRVTPDARRRIVAAAGSLAVGAVLASACVVQVDSPYQMVEQHRFEVSGVPDIDLTTFDGSIEVRGWSRQEVSVEIERLGASKELVEAIPVTFEQDGDRVRVEVRRPEGVWTTSMLSGPSSRGRIVASVPMRSNLTVHSGDGAISVERLEGRVELTTRDGSVRGIDLSGDVRVQSADGSIRLDAVEGRCEASTDDGTIGIAGTLDVVRARSGDGSITLRAESGSRMSDDWSVQTGDGRVVLYLPESFGATLDLLTGDGTISSELDAIDIEPSRDRRSGERRFRGVIGQADHTVTVRTEDGPIRVRPS